MAGAVFGCAYSIWHEPEADEVGIGWLRGTADAVASKTIGHYVRRGRPRPAGGRAPR